MNPWLLAAWIGCQAFDGATTAVALQRGAIELNPILSAQPARLYPIKIGVNLGAYLWARRLPKGPQRAVGALFAATGCAAGAWNIRQLHVLK